MERNQTIETIGSITKKERLKHLDRNILPNTLVLKTINPFPGIRNNMDGFMTRIPESLFIILRYRYSSEKIHRIYAKLKQKNKLTVLPGHGEIIHGSGILPCIRIKGLEDYTQLEAIQSHLLKNDLQLMTYKELDNDCKIKIFKNFKLVEIGDGLYRDLIDIHKVYIRIENPINWKRFDTVINKIKFNLEDNQFDAALGVIYRFSGSENVIRILDRQVTLKRAIELRKAILKEFKNEIHLSAAHKLDYLIP